MRIGEVGWEKAWDDTYGESDAAYGTFGLSDVPVPDPRKKDSPSPEGDTQDAQKGIEPEAVPELVQELDALATVICNPLFTPDEPEAKSKLEEGHENLRGSVGVDQSDFV